MNRNEALGLVGSKVSAWTAANGEYEGVLTEITNASPWRGKVRIECVTKPATVYEFGHKPRRGFRPGETIEVGHSSIKPIAEYSGGSYIEALERELAKMVEYRDRLEARKDHNLYVFVHAVKELTKALEEERAR